MRGFIGQTLLAGNTLENINTVSASCSLTIGMEAMLHKNRIHIFPNPFTNNILERGAGGGEYYSIINLFGQMYGPVIK